MSVLYKNQSAVNQLDITEIHISKDRYQGKTYFGAECYFLKDHICPNGDKLRLSCISMTFDKVNKAEIVRFFECEILKRYSV